jgi:hypothetical protein
MTADLGSTGFSDVTPCTHGEQHTHDPVRLR